MIVIEKPSLQGRISLIWSGDCALQPRPLDDDHAAQWDRDIEVCRETGQWDAMLKPGDVPTVFTFELPRGTRRRAVIDLIDRMLSSRTNELYAIFFRVTLRSVSGMGGFKVSFARDDELGMDMARDDIVEILDDVDRSIILELSNIVARRLRKTPEKS